jgi:hypothetical protein
MDPGEIVKAGHLDELKMALHLLQRALELALKSGANSLEVSVIKELASRLGRS